MIRDPRKCSASDAQVTIMACGPLVLYNIQIRIPVNADTNKLLFLYELMIHVLLHLVWSVKDVDQHVQYCMVYSGLISK